MDVYHLLLAGGAACGIGALYTGGKRWHRRRTDQDIQDLRREEEYLAQITGPLPAVREREVVKVMAHERYDISAGDPWYEGMGTPQEPVTEVFAFQAPARPAVHRAEPQYLPPQPPVGSLLPDTVGFRAADEFAANLVQDTDEWIEQARRRGEDLGTALRQDTDAWLAQRELEAREFMRQILGPQGPLAIGS